MRDRASPNSRAGYGLYRSRFWGGMPIRKLGANPVNYAIRTDGHAGAGFPDAAAGDAAAAPHRLELALSFRRPLGLFAFFYAVGHLPIFFGLDREPEHLQHVQRDAQADSTCSSAWEPCC